MKLFKNHFEILFHILFWVFSTWMLVQYYSFESVEVREDNGIRKEVYIKDYRLMYYFVIGIFAKLILVYGNALWIFPAFLKKKNLARFCKQFILLLAGAILLEFLLVRIYARFWSENNFDINYYTSLWQLNALFYFFYIGLSVAYALFKNYLKNEKIKQQLIAEKMESELDFLKSQINPHFLFNTLNNLYALAERKDHPELSKGIVDLSNVMRYMLYDCKSDFVDLEKELTLIESIVEMHQLRFDEQDNMIVAMNIEGSSTNKKIAPLILVPFVENAFKHGIELKQSSYIKIHFEIQEDKFIFNIVNSNFKSDRPISDHHSGIGLTNVRRRLELIYPDQYQLDINELESSFEVKLEISDLNK